MYFRTAHRARLARPGAVAVLAILLVLVTACEAPEPRARTTVELMEDPAVLQGVLIRCADGVRTAVDASECANARLAAERLAVQDEDRRAADRAAEFERLRQERRVREERERQAAQQQRERFDPYSSPIAIAPEPVPPVAAAGGGDRNSPSAP